MKSLYDQKKCIDNLKKNVLDRKITIYSIKLQFHELGLNMAANASDSNLFKHWGVGLLTDMANFEKQWSQN